MSVTTYRGWNITAATIGFDIQHPDYDRENEIDWRHGHADSIDGARIEIDRLLAEDAEWTKAASIVKQWQGEDTTPKPPAGGDAGAVGRAYRQVQIDMRDRAAAVCDERGAEEQESYGLNRAAQNYFRARNAVRALELAALALPAPVVEGDERLREALAGAFRLVDGMAGAMNGVPNEPTSDQADIIAGDLADLLNVPFDENWPAVVAAALSEGRSHG